MNLAPLEQIRTLASAEPNRRNQEAMRQAAQQFEAVLLTQLTSSLNQKESDGEDSLFGSDGGTGLAKQLFSEQLAETMAESGGIGLQDVIMRQLGGAPATSKAAPKDAFAKMISVVREIKENKPAAKIDPVNSAPDEAVIISTFEDELRTEGLDESLKNLLLDGRLQNSTRPRLAPDRPIGVLSAPDSPVSNPAVNLSYQMPVAGRISSDFGNRFHPIDKRVKFHGGVDIAVPKGTAIGAAADGVVSFAGWKDGYGNLVVIKHADGRETRYGHLEKILVADGEPVGAGNRIALSGSTGKSTGPHLHFEVRENGELVNPLKIMSNVLAKNVDR
jgi:murein DD-endopeptidase MepM/ murein hydrolase activator NlpD